MINSKQIQSFKNNLNSKDKDEINDFLIRVGSLLRLEDPEDIETETVIKTVDLLYAIHKKFCSLNSSEDISSEVENMMVNCKGKGAFLRRKLKLGELDEIYFTNISRLGKQILELANLLTLFGITLI